MMIRKRRAFFITCTILGFLFLIQMPLLLHAEQKIQEIIIKLKQNSQFDHSPIDAARSYHKKMALATIDPLFSVEQKRKPKFTSLGLNRTYKITPPAGSDIEQLLQEFQHDPQIEYAHLNHTYRIDGLPDDPFINKQWLIKTIQLDRAWEIESGNADILIAIIDTGVDYNHEDLSANLWLNSGEDINNNGIIDSSDFNATDDDGNGFIDDLQGWDFTDAPHFPDGGDYLTRDNDPMDEHGHGTAVAGIVGAVANNKIGVAGIAFRCRLMNLRAGTSQGLLEEDDVASAIVYAVENGARIINMSFGDVVASPLLHDVMRFAYFNNCVLIASAGNSASSDIHYPSGYNETIAVGATTNQDVLASFSNYGAAIDLVAPGVSLWSTKLNNRYGEFSGTSAAAPVVSGIAALVLSHRPSLTNKDVTNILLASVDDLGLSGWDNIYGAGRVNALKALQIDFISQAKIDYPLLDNGFHQPPLIIVGTASGAFLDSYQLYYGIGNNPDNWFLLEHVKQRQIINSYLTEWDFTSVIDTSYTIRLRVINKDGSSIEDRTRIFIDRTPPQISRIKTTEMITRALPSVMIEFETDDLCQCSIYYRALESSENYDEIKLNYFTRKHRYNFTSEKSRGKYEFYLRAINSSGLVSHTDVLKNHLIDLTRNQVPTDQFIPVDYHLPAGYPLRKIADFDGDGNYEVVMNEFSSNGSFDRLKIYEFEANQFLEVFRSHRLAIPRDWGDSDSDGLLEILAGAGPVSFIFESPIIGSNPSVIVWADSNDCWASRFSDMDSDSRREIIVKKENSYQIWECIDNNRYAFIASLENPTPGANNSGVPHTEIGDFDGDGFMEILIGDYDGDVYIYEAAGDNSFRYTWSQRQPLIDCTDYISSGDYDGDGIMEFAVGSHSPPELDAEHEYDARHWIFRIYKRDGDNSYSFVWEQAFFGFTSLNNTVNGITSGDIDNDGNDELLINIFPNFYVIQYDSQRNRYHSIWFFSPTYSQTNVIGDIDNDGCNEFLIHDGSQLTAFKAQGTEIAVLPPPLNFDAFPLNTDQVQLRWSEVAGATSYSIFKGRTASQMVEFHKIVNTEFVDSLVIQDSTYWYAVSAVNFYGNGRRSSSIAVIPNEPPYISTAEFIPTNQIRVIFSEPMNISITDVTHYLFSGGLDYPSSVIVSKSSREVILSLSTPFLPNENYTVRVVDVADLNRTPIDTLKNWAIFRAEFPASAPYLIRAEFTYPQEIGLYFNEPLEPISASETENYVIEPSVLVDQTTLDVEDSSQVRLKISSIFPIGALGKKYIITVFNVKNRSGIPIKSGEGNQASLIFYQPDLSQLFTYPNPYRTTEGNGYLMFANLTKQATIKILTINGEVIREIHENNGDGGIAWDLRDENGRMVSSGIYLYYVQSAGNSKAGKFAIIR